jgi:hypothetical protein
MTSCSFRHPWMGRKTSALNDIGDGEMTSELKDIGDKK